MESNENGNDMKWKGMKFNENDMKWKLTEYDMKKKWNDNDMK